MANWDEAQGGREADRTSVLDGIPQGMPALALADKVVGRADRVGITPPLRAVPATEEELGARCWRSWSAPASRDSTPSAPCAPRLRRLENEIRSAEVVSS